MARRIADVGLRWSWPVVGYRPVPVTATRRLRLPDDLRRFVSWKLLLILFLAMKCVAVPLAILAIPLLTDTAKAELTEAKTDEKTMSKTITGAIVAVSKQAVSVEYSRVEQHAYEMLLPVSEDVQLNHLANLKELNVGDLVRVQYEQTYREGDDGEPVILKTLAREITLVKRATSGDALRSAEQGQLTR